MITKMSHATVWVKNQQEALEFYRDKLGFEVDTDAMIGDDYRWLTMRIKGQPGFEIILMEPKPGYILYEESAAQLKALMEKGVLGAGVFEADDIYKTYEELKAQGVEFKGPPTTQSWGTATVMKDNSGTGSASARNIPRNTTSRGLISVIAFDPAGATRGCFAGITTAGGNSS